MERRDHRRARVLSSALLGLVTVVALTGTASAQDRSEVAREQFRRGVELMRDERFQAAAEAFRASYDASPRVATMCNLALAYDRWGAYPEITAESYERCAREDTSGRYQAHAAQRAEELRAELAGREPAPGPREPAPEPTLPPDPFVRDGAAGQASASGAGASGPGAPPLTAQPPPPAETSSGGHGLLWAGVAAGGVSLASLVGAVLLASSASGDEDHLRRTYPDSDGDGVFQIPRGSAGEEILDSAETKAGWSIALYAVSGATAALAAALIVLDLTAPGESDTAPQVGIAPVEGGAMITGSYSIF